MVQSSQYIKDFVEQDIWELMNQFVSRSTQNNFIAVEGDHNARLKQHRDHLTREK